MLTRCQGDGAQCQATNLITSSTAACNADTSPFNIFLSRKNSIFGAGHTPDQERNWDFDGSQDFAEISNFAVIDDHLCGGDRAEVGQTDRDVEKSGGKIDDKHISGESV